MSDRQRRAVRLFSRLDRGEVTVDEVAGSLERSKRQVQRIRKRVDELGPAGVLHGNLGRAPKHKIGDEVRARILELHSGTYAGFNDHHFTEKLVEVEKIDISRQDRHHPPSAQRQVQRRLARKLADLPQIDAAFAAGELSYCKVRALSRVADADSEAVLLEDAKLLTGAQLERLVANLRRAKIASRAPDEDGDETTEPARFFRQETTDEGMVRLTFQLTAEEAAVVTAALDAAPKGVRGAEADRRRSSHRPLGKRRQDLHHQRHLGVPSPPRSAP